MNVTIVLFALAIAGGVLEFLTALIEFSREVVKFVSEMQRKRRER